MAALDAEKRLACDVARLLDECRLSDSLHPRKIKELTALRSSSPACFFRAFSAALAPLFAFARNTPASDRAVRFVSAFAARDGDAGAVASAFLEEFLRFLLVAAAAADRHARLRGCQIIPEIVMRLPEDTEVEEAVWDELIELMKQRVDDKVPAIRVHAVRSLSRLSNDGEGGEILNLFIRTIAQEPSAEVRKAIVLSLPPTNETSIAIVEATLDVSELVRKAAYSVLAAKFPLQSLSIKLRTTLLQRGLSDRSPSVRKECSKILNQEWLPKCCDGDLISLLRFLDVETYESVGEAVMEALLDGGVLGEQEVQSIKQFLAPSYASEGESQDTNIQLMEAEVALYWRTLCNHILRAAQAKGSDAAIATGAEATVYASEASANNDLLDELLPATVSDYVLVSKAHLSAGPNYRFVSRQLLLLGSMLDFSDVSNRRVASAFVRELLLRPLEYEEDDDGNKVVIGDGISLGGDDEWSRAVSELAKKVYSAAGEFEDVVSGVVEELARPCRERTADFIQWMHCLAVTDFLLTNTKSLSDLRGKSVEPSEILHSLLLPGAKQGVVDVQRVATRCLCLYGLLERRPSEDLVRQLRLFFTTGLSPVRVMAAKSLFDLAMWHGIEQVDQAIGIAPQLPAGDDISRFTTVNLLELEEVGIVGLLYSGLQIAAWGGSTETEDHESVQVVIAEGFSKFLILSENYPGIPRRLLPLILCKLIKLYFFDDNKEQQRMKQCLSVFFEHYPTLTYDNKKCISSSFVPAMRSMWPGINGNPGGSPALVSKMRKRAVQAARFMLQMIQTPLYSKKLDEKETSESSPQRQSKQSSNFESGEEGLAIRIAEEVIRFPEKKSAAEKSYVSALCRIAILLRFRPSEQNTVKCMRGLLNGMISSVSFDKEMVKELNSMVVRLKQIDESPDQDLPQEQADAIFEALELAGDLKMEASSALPPTPAPRTERRASVRRRVQRESSTDEEDESPPARPAVPSTPAGCLISARSQRASKTAAMHKITMAKTNMKFSDAEDEEDLDDMLEDSDESSEQCGLNWGHGCIRQVI